MLKTFDAYGFVCQFMTCLWNKENIGIQYYKIISQMDHDQLIQQLVSLSRQIKVKKHFES